MTNESAILGVIAEQYVEIANLRATVEQQAGVIRNLQEQQASDTKAEDARA